MIGIILLAVVVVFACGVAYWALAAPIQPRCDVEDCDRQKGHRGPHKVLIGNLIEGYAWRRLDNER